MLLVTTLTSLTLVGVPAPQSCGDADPFAPATPESQGLEAKDLADLVGIVQEYYERDFFVGAELLVVKNRRTVLHEYFGHADREEELQWDGKTICNIRSMTKCLTGAALQILVDREEVSIDDYVVDYLPGFDTDKARDITIRQVLTHRAGLPLTILQQSLDEYPNLESMANAVGRRGPDRKPGSRFWYSDSGTDVVGAIVEIISEQTLDEFIRAELLEPLGMRDSFYYLDGEDPRRERIGSLYLGSPGKWSRYFDPSERPFYPYAWGSQTLYSTPLDYARFLAMWMDGGKWNTRQILSPAAVERTLTPVSEMSMLGSSARFPTSFQGLEVMYGQMSVLHTPLSSQGEGPAVIIGHSGSDGTIAWAWPKRDLMILFFTQSRGGAAVLRLEEPIDRLLINPEAYVGHDEIPDELQPYLGSYIADWSSYMKEEFVVRVRNGKLALDIPSQMLFELEKLKDQEKWRFAISSGVTVWFERHGDEAINCLRVRQGRTSFEAPRKGTPHAKEVALRNLPDPDVVEEISGIYQDASSDTQLKVFLKGDYMALQEPEGTYHLWKVPDQDTWQVRENPAASITFQKDGGIVISMTRRIPGVPTAVMERIE